jgi:hypothetical protein
MAEALEDARKEIDQKKLRDAAKRAKLKIKAEYCITNVDPFDVWDIAPQPERGWDKFKVLSEKQLDLLRKIGVDGTKVPYAQGKQLIVEFFRRQKMNMASLGQAKVLKKNGITVPMRRHEAKHAIDAIALAQGWGGKK